MTAKESGELRQAAKQARALAGGLIEASAKKGFLDLAVKFDAEALALETINLLAFRKP